VFSFAFLEQKTVGSSGSLPLALGNAYKGVFLESAAVFKVIFSDFFSAFFSVFL
jgi:hypothetical protein